MIQIPCVFQQYFQPDEAENQTAGPGGVTTELFPQFKTDGASQKEMKKVTMPISCSEYYLLSFRFTIFYYTIVEEE